MRLKRGPNDFKIKLNGEMASVAAVSPGPIGFTPILVRPSDYCGTGMGGRIAERGVPVAGRDGFAAAARDLPLLGLSTDSK